MDAQIFWHWHKFLHAFRHLSRHVCWHIFWQIFWKISRHTHIIIYIYMCVDLIFIYRLYFICIYICMCIPTISNKHSIIPRRAIPCQMRSRVWRDSQRLTQSRADEVHSFSHSFIQSFHSVISFSHFISHWLVVEKPSWKIYEVVNGKDDIPLIWNRK